MKKLWFGRFRICFNRHGAFPLMWIVAPVASEGDQSEVVCEIAVREVLFDGVDVRTVYRRKETPDDEDGRPSGWLEAAGGPIVNETGIARIVGAP